MSKGKLGLPGSKSAGKPGREKQPGAVRGAAPAGTVTRRNFLGLVGAGSIAAAGGACVFIGVRSVVPNVLYEPPKRVKVGELGRFSDGGTFIASERLFVFRDKQTLYSLSAVCSHLGCTVQLAKMPEVEGGFEFHCPCHGSKFRWDGSPFAGPAPAPLTYYELEVAADDGQLVVDKGKKADKGWRLTVGA